MSQKMTNRNSKSGIPNKSKKRKVKRKACVVLILAAILLVLCGVLLFKYIQKVNYEKEQKARHEEAAEWLDQRKQFEERIASAFQGDLDQEQFETLKSLAAGETDYSWISAITPETEITDEMEEKLKSMPENENGFSKLLFSLDQIPGLYAGMAITDPDRLDFVLAYSERETMQNPPETLDESLDSIPLLIQWDKRWGYVPYGDQTIAVAGCGPTSMAMVLSGLNQDPSITPAVLANMADENGLYVIGAGSSHEIFPFLAASYGVSCTPIDSSVETLVDLTSQNIPMILQMLPGDFTRTGHFIVITGMQNGKLKVNDPNSKQRSAKLWDPETIAGQSAGGWMFTREEAVSDEEGGA